MMKHWKQINYRDEGVERHVLVLETGIYFAYILSPGQEEWHVTFTDALGTNRTFDNLEDAQIYAEAELRNPLRAPR